MKNVIRWEEGPVGEGEGSCMEKCSVVMGSRFESRGAEGSFLDCLGRRAVIGICAFVVTV